MAAPSLPDSGLTSFADKSYLNYVIPAETGLDLERTFESLAPGKGLEESIQTRESLFFGKATTFFLSIDPDN